MSIPVVPVPAGDRYAVMHRADGERWLLKLGPDVDLSAPRREKPTLAIELQGITGGNEPSIYAIHLYIYPDGWSGEKPVEITGGTNLDEPLPAGHEHAGETPRSLLPMGLVLEEDPDGRWLPTPRKDLNVWAPSR